MRPLSATQLKHIRRFGTGAVNASRGILAAAGAMALNYLLFHYYRPLFERYAYLITMASLLLVFCNWGGKDHAIKWLSAEPGNSKSMVSELISSRILLLFPLLALVLFFADGWYELVFLVLLTALRALASIADALVTLEKKFSQALWADASGFIALFLLLLLVPEIPLSVFLLAFLAAELLRLFFISHRLSNRISFRFHLRPALELIRRSAPFFLVSLAGFVCARGDLYMLGYFFEKESLGRYFILIGLVNLCQVIYAAVLGAFSAQVFRMPEKSFRSLIAYQVTAGAGFALAAALGTYTVANLVFNLHLGPVFLLLFFFNTWFFTIVLSGMYDYTRQDRQPRIILVLLAAAATNLLTALFLVPAFGMAGALCSNTLGLAVNFILLYSLRPWKR